MVGYVVKNTADVTSEMFEVCLCNAETCRKSSDQAKIVLKFEAEAVPSIFASETVLTRSQIGEEFTKEGWSNDV